MPLVNDPSEKTDLKKAAPVIKSSGEQMTEDRTAEIKAKQDAARKDIASEAKASAKEDAADAKAEAKKAKGKK